jgi:hypothetical protein
VRLLAAHLEEQPAGAPAAKRANLEFGIRRRGRLKALPKQSFVVAFANRLILRVHHPRATPPPRKRGPISKHDGVT